MRNLPFLLLALSLTVLPGCDAIVRIFEVSVWAGVAIVVAVLVVVGGLVAALTRR